MGCGFIVIISSENSRFFFFFGYPMVCHAPGWASQKLVHGPNYATDPILSTFGTSTWLLESCFKWYGVKINFILLVAVQMLELLAMHHFIFLWLLWTLCHLLLNNLCHPSDDMIHISMLIKNTNCKYGNLFLFASVGLFILLLESLCFQEWHFQLHKNGYGFYFLPILFNLE